MIMRSVTLPFVVCNIFHALMHHLLSDALQSTEAQMANVLQLNYFHLADADEIDASHHVYYRCKTYGLSDFGEHTRTKIA